MLKKISIAVLGMAANGIASAGTMGPVCAPGNVTVPCEAKRWDLGVQALYFKSTYSAEKAYEFTNPTVTNYGDIKNDWAWGYRLEGSYHFNTGNDATITWMHYKDTTDGVGIGIYSTIVFPVAELANFSGSYLNQLDQVNLVLGQHVDMSLSDKLRFYGGLQYARIETGATQTYQNSAVPGVFTAINQSNNSDYKGVGPVVGIDYAYYVTQGLSLTANGSGSILYGKSRFSNDFIGLPVNLVFSSRSGNKQAVVPSLEAKLGLNYEYVMPQGALNLQAGYQALNYFNAIQTVTRNTFNSGFAVAESDYGLYGPYFGLKYVGNA